MKEEIMDFLTIFSFLSVFLLFPVILMSIFPKFADIILIAFPMWITFGGYLCYRKAMKITKEERIR